MVMIRYHGRYSNAKRGKVRKTQERATPYFILGENKPFVPSKGWAGIIHHLELTCEVERPPPPHHIQQELLMAA